MALTLNDNGWVVFLRVLSGELVAFRPEWWKPSVGILIDIDCDDIPPLPGDLYTRLKNDTMASFRNDLGAFAEGVLGISIPGYLKDNMPQPETKVVPRRRFIKGRDKGTGMVAWIETRPLWVDVPA